MGWDLGSVACDQFSQVRTMGVQVGPRSQNGNGTACAPCQSYVCVTTKRSPDRVALGAHRLVERRRATVWRELDNALAGFGAGYLLT